jgi:murein DD-endopeptidase MepM/ murein hydrolase activator NlpD
VFVLIRHNEDGLTSGYFHLKRYFVNNGQKVKAGQQIGEVGRTGIKRSLPHLHFELRHWATRLDPVRYFGGEILPYRATYHGQYMAGNRIPYRKARRWLRARARQKALDAREQKEARRGKQIARAF